MSSSDGINRIATAIFMYGQHMVVFLEKLEFHDSEWMDIKSSLQNFYKKTLLEVFVQAGNKQC